MASFASVRNHLFELLSYFYRALHVCNLMLFFLLLFFLMLFHTHSVVARSIRV